MKTLLVSLAIAGTALMPPVALLDADGAVAARRTAVTWLVGRASTARAMTAELWAFIVAVEVLTPRAPAAVTARANDKDDTELPAAA